MFRRRTVRQDRPGADTKNLLLARLSSLLNRAIEFDEKTRYRIAELGDCSIAFQLRGANARILVTISNGELSLSSNLETKPDVRIEGGLTDFIAMARTQRDGTTLAAGKVEIQGDLATAQQIQTVIAEAAFDWEELIASRTGDVLARQIGRGVRGGISWVLASGKILERDVSEYLHYEQRLLPTDREIEHFVQEGTAIAAGVERLQARISRIQRRRGQS